MNGGIYSTGNEIVDENAKLNISGNIIPQVWYRTIIRESGKPNLTAIIILADIVYWYKGRHYGNGNPFVKFYGGTLCDAVISAGKAASRKGDLPF